MAIKKTSLFDWLKQMVQRGRAKFETRKSKEWFRSKLEDYERFEKKVQSSKAYKNKKLKEINEGSLGDKPTIGSMYMYYYDPKFKETLPYYDRFPLIILVGPAKGGFYGLNLHYLSPILRAKFLDNLTDTLTNEAFDESTRFRITYKMLTNINKFRYFKPTFKHYLFKHLSSQVKLVPPEEWHKMVFLETAIWKTSKTNVYKQSRMQIR